MESKIKSLKKEMYGGSSTKPKKTKKVNSGTQGFYSILVKFFSDKADDKKKQVKKADDKKKQVKKVDDKKKQVKKATDKKKQVKK